MQKFVLEQTSQSSSVRQTEDRKMRFTGKSRGGQGERVTGSTLKETKNFNLSFVHCLSLCVVALSPLHFRSLFPSIFPSCKLLLHAFRCCRHVCSNTLKKKKKPRLAHRSCTRTVGVKILVMGLKIIGTLFLSWISLGARNVFNSFSTNSKFEITFSAY